MCKNCVHYKIMSQTMETSTQEKELWFYLRLFWSYSSDKVKLVNFIVIHNVASFDARKNAIVPSFPLPTAVKSSMYEWFHSNNFETLMWTFRSCTDNKSKFRNSAISCFRFLILSLPTHIFLKIPDPDLRFCIRIQHYVYQLQNLV